MTKARDIASAAPAPSTVSATELGYLDGVTSNIQTQIDSKTGGVATDTPPSSPTEGQVWLDTDGTTADANFSLTSHNHNSDYIAKTLTTTTGDIIYASSANNPARLGIGSTSQVLTVSGGVPAWATPTAPAMVFITGASFSAVSSVSLPTNTFTSTYDIYKIFFQFSAASSTSVIQLRMRNSGTDVTSGGYFFGGFGTDYFSSTTVYKNGSANSAWTINADANIDRTTWELTFTNPQNSSFGGQGWITGMGDRMAAYSSGLWQNAVSTFDSMSIIKSTSGTISGKYAVYGLVKS
jgi:hypothetical protein